MPFCTNCGNQNADTSKFCTTCGADLVQQTKIVESEAPLVHADQVQPTIPITTQLENDSQAQPLISPISNSSNIDIGKFLNKYKNPLVYGFGIIVALFAIYYFFLRHDPVKDAKKIASGYCNCSTKYNDAMVKVNEDFVNSFNSNNFKKRQDARNKLQEFQNPVNAENLECNNKEQTRYNNLRNRYISNVKQLTKFDLTYNSVAGLCNPDNQARLNATYTEIENKISTIRDPEPDIEKIKADLIGQEIIGWKFAYLNEYKSAEILNTSKSTDRIEYQVKFNLIDNTSNTGEHDCEVMVVYLQGESGWYLSAVNPIYIIYTYTLYPDRYVQIIPYQNCKWNADNSYKMSWKTSDWEYASETITGPDKGATTLPFSTTYFIKSLEPQEIKVKFTYRPNN